MKDFIKMIIRDYRLTLKRWSREHVAGFAIFNTTMLLLVMLRSAGYFEPFFPLTISFIVLAGLVLSAILLGLGSRVIFAFGLLFFGLALVFNLATVQIWAERMGIYTYQAILIGIALYVIESVRNES